MNICQSEENCTGCLACYNICPVDAIETKQTKFGELRPQINTEKCIHCQKCIRVCSSINNVQKEAPIKVFAAFAAQAQNRKDASSGGVASLLSNTFFRKGKKVFGVCFKKKEPVYCLLKTQNDIEKSKGSKYVAPSIGYIYRNVKDELSKDEDVLFIGTPCIVSALKSYLGCDPSNLYTIDLVCHGVAPWEYLDEHLKKIRITEFDDIKFRGEKDYYLTVLDARKKKIYSKFFENDMYFYPMMKGISLQKCCTLCPYTTQYRTGDITLGDFWGLKSSFLNERKEKKSLVFLNTEKGIKVFDMIREELIFEERPLDEALAGNRRLQGQKTENSSNVLFRERYAQIGDYYSAIKEMGIRKKVLINTFCNYIMYIPRKLKKLISNS